MKKSWIVTIAIVVVVGGAFYRLSSNKAAMEAELAARKRVAITVPVTIVDANPKPVSRNLSIDGILVPKEDVVVLAQTGGQVLQIFHEVGDHVENGTPLAQIDVHVQESQLAMARTSLENSKRDLERFENLLKAGAASQQTVDNLRLSVENAQANVVALEKQVSNAKVQSPLRGTITKRNVERGSVLGAGSPAFTVADLGNMVMRVGLTESEISGIREGAKAQVHVDVLGKDYSGTVTTVGVAADLSGRYTVEVRLQGFRPGELLQDMSGSVHLSLPPIDSLPVIPRRALVGGVQSPKVFVVEDSTAHLRPIVTALVSGSDVVVAEGLKTGDRVVTTGQLNLVDGTKVQVMQ